MLNRLSPDGKTSMLQIWKPKEKQKWKPFAGAVEEARGKEDAIITPENSTFFNLIRAVESN